MAIQRRDDVSNLSDLKSATRVDDIPNLAGLRQSNEAKTFLA